MEQVHPRDFWVALVGIALLLGGRETYYILTGKVFTVPEGMLAVFLSLVWLTFLSRLGRGPRNPVVIPYMLALVGYTLSLGDTLIPHLGTMELWAQRIGPILTALSVVWLYLAFLPFFQKSPAGGDP